MAIDPSVHTDPAIEQFETRYSRLGVNETAPEFLYHYTNEAGLRAILSGAQIRNSHILDMRNDVDEFKHGMRMFRDQIQSLVSRGFHPDVAENVKTFFNQEMENPLGVPCILCTTPVANKEYHWREYAGNGTGYCLKLKPQKLPTTDVIYCGSPRT